MDTDWSDLSVGFSKWL